MNGETSVALSMDLEKHLKEQHELAVGSAFMSEKSKNEIKYLTQYKKGSDTESKEECYVRTHSETMCKVRSQDVEELLAKVSQLKEQRRETCKLAPCFPCPLCGRLVEGDTENELSNDLKVHFIEDHDI